jgi:hypothetical protein
LEYFISAWEAGSLDAGDNASLLFESGAGDLFPERRDMAKGMKGVVAFRAPRCIWQMHSMVVTAFK